MPPDATWVQMATIGAEATERLANETRTRRPDVTFVDAPVSGSREPAEKGQLLILASGPPQRAERSSSRSSRRWDGPPSGSVPPAPGAG